MAGFYPIHPSSYMNAWRNRQAIEKEKAKAEEEKAKEESGTTEEN